ncbi:glycosyltransferase family 4 protein [Cryobacterium sp. TMT4-10]|uniref:glycosyltransferase family 4 protein n=1 Tax=Cryobacterium sp. TMT4-10 TaxID=1259256 RepID=UPI00106CB0E3|nr:glycosyltransferase family 4 protein [Cryobacterium sp. TMT4-10]TFD16300.1 glycosyltransferase WbuB [Cryobacterium sp. TMT4-10]
MRIGVLSQWFDPEPGGGAIPGIYSREFVAAGHEVSVLTGFPNYPSGRIYPGYPQRLRTVTREAGYSLTRVPLYPSHNSSSLGRIANYATFAASATLLSHSALKNVDGIWVYNSPITVSLPLLAHSRWGRTPYFLQVQDLWPDSLIDSGMFPGGLIGKAASTMLSGLVRLMEDRAGFVGVSSPGARDLLLDRNPRLDPQRVVNAPNPTDESVFYPLSELSPSQIPDVPWRDRFTVMYAGAVGDVQGLESLIDAAAIIRSHGDINIVVVGDGIARPKLEARVAALGLKNVDFVGRVDKQLVPGYMATAQVQLVSLAERKFLKYTMPSKITSLLASCVPIIGQISGDGAQLIQESGAGLIAEPGSAESLAAKILEMASLSDSQRGDMAKLGRFYYEENLSSAVLAANVTRAFSTFSTFSRFSGSRVNA